jgi:hypothetical protein
VCDNSPILSPDPVSTDEPSTSFLTAKEYVGSSFPKLALFKVSGSRPSSSFELWTGARLQRTIARIRKIPMPHSTQNTSLAAVKDSFCYEMLPIHPRSFRQQRLLGCCTTAAMQLASLCRSRRSDSFSANSGASIAARVGRLLVDSCQPPPLIEGAHATGIGMDSCEPTVNRGF